MVDTAWLDAEGTDSTPESDNTAWLDAPSSVAPMIRHSTSVTRLVETERRHRKTRAPKAAKAKMTLDRERFKSMAFEDVKGRKRVWACDGEFVAVRLNQANPHTQGRHQKFLESGHYEHVETQDDVQIYRLLDGSPFKRKFQFHSGEIKDNDLFLMTAKAAVVRDWPCYVDLLEEMAGRLKARLDPANQKLVWNEYLERLFTNIAQRGGPGQPEIDAGLSNTMKKRGTGKGRVIALPTAAARAR